FLLLFFFFSSRRRHTRFSRDWSSDVCSSDLLAVVGLAIRYVLPKLLHLLSHSQELLVLFGISWAVALAALGDTLGFSKEVGAFEIGRASCRVRVQISAVAVTVIIESEEVITD